LDFSGEKIYLKNFIAGVSKTRFGKGAMNDLKSQSINDKNRLVELMVASLDFFLSNNLPNRLRLIYVIRD